MLPEDPVARSWRRSISGEMHSGFANLRSALPINLKVRHDGFRVWAGAQSDIERIKTIWRECLTAFGGPLLFGPLSVADAMYAPVCTRFETYDVALDPLCSAYQERVLNLAPMRAWRAAALAEPEELEELDIEF